MNKSTYNSRSADKFVVRLPEGMRDLIQGVAKNHRRSMNSEIVKRLNDSLIADGVVPPLAFMEACENPESDPTLIPVGSPVLVKFHTGHFKAILVEYVLTDEDEFRAKIATPRRLGTNIVPINTLTLWNGE